MNAREVSVRETLALIGRPDDEFAPEGAEAYGVWLQLEDPINPDTDLWVALDGICSHLVEIMGDYRNATQLAWRNRDPGTFNHYRVFRATAALCAELDFELPAFRPRKRLPMNKKFSRPLPLP